MQRLTRMGKRNGKDVEFIKQAPLHPRQRLAGMKKQNEKDVEIIKRVPFHPTQRLIRKTKKRKYPRDRLKEKGLQRARNDVSALMEGNFDFSAKILLSKTLFFDMWRINEELIMDKIIENFPGEGWLRRGR